MGTIADKLTYLSDTKVAIHDAIVAGGVSIPVGTPFRNYASLIGQVKNLVVPTWSYVLPLTADINPTVGATVPTYNAVNAVTYTHNVNGRTVYGATTPIFENGALRMLPTMNNLLGSFSSGQKILSLAAYSYQTLSFKGTGSVSVTGQFTGTLNGTGANNYVSLAISLGGTGGNVTFTITGSCSDVQLLTTEYASKVYCDAQVTPALSLPNNTVNVSTGTIYFEYLEDTTYSVNTWSWVLSDSYGGQAVLITGGNYSSLGNQIIQPTTYVWRKIAISYDVNSAIFVIDGKFISQRPGTSVISNSNAFKIFWGDYYIKNLKISSQAIDAASLVNLTK